MPDLLSATAVSIIGSVCGAVVSVLLTLYLTRKSRRGVAGSASPGQQVTITVRVVEEKAEQARAAKSIRSSRPATSASLEPGEVFLLAVVAFVVMAAVVAGYLRIKDVLLLVIIVMISFSLAAALGGLITAAILKIRFGPGVRTQAIVNAGLGVAGVTGVYLVSHPFFVPADTDLGPMMALGSTASMTTLLREVDPEVVAYVFVQILGLMCLVAGMIFVVLHSTKLYATQRVVVVASNNPAATAHISRWVLRLGPSPSLCFRAGVFLVIASLALVSGALFTFFVWLPQAISAALV